jgi:regulator of replication initiation timing
LEKARASRAPAPEKIEGTASFGSETEATLRRLREQVAGLKAEIGEQQAERRQLRRMLTNERKKLADLSESGATAQEPGAAEEASAVEPAGRLLLPEYAEGLRKRWTSPARTARREGDIGGGWLRRA